MKRQDGEAVYSFMILEFVPLINAVPIAQYQNFLSIGLEEICWMGVVLVVAGRLSRGEREDMDEMMVEDVTVLVLPKGWYLSCLCEEKGMREEKGAFV